MTRGKYIVGLFFLIALIAILHNISLTYFLYWRFLWTDIVMHFLGGLFIALGGYLFLFDKTKFSIKEILFYTIGASLLVGLGWEVFEYVFDIVPYTKWYVPDTVSDILMDIVGGIVGFFAVFLISIKKEKI